jgi:tripartite-type tricarboxylate transporter receptor subunit TctC
MAGPPDPHDRAVRGRGLDRCRRAPGREQLSRTLGQQVYVENRTGANGNIGIEAAAKSEADGYTVLIAPDAIASNPHVYKVNYDALKDLTP